MESEIVDQIQAIWRYPVKSMRGEPIAQAWLDERGIIGDRVYAIRERETGFIASAKHPRKWAALLSCQAQFAEPPLPGQPLPAVHIVMPNGMRISSIDSDCNSQLSTFLGRDVELVTQPIEGTVRESNRTPLDRIEGDEIIREEAMGAASLPGSFFDYAPIHILTTATVRRLQQHYPAGRMPIERFRPNLVINNLNGVEGTEYAWLDNTMMIGDPTKLRIIDPTPRCVVTTLPQGDLPRDPEILRIIHQQPAISSITAAPGMLLSAVAGVYAQVLCNGWIRINDAVRT
jgi:uncharacterized protein